MQYISPENEYPRFIGDIQLEHPDYRQGDELPEGWQLVVDADIPEPNQDEIVYEDFPVEIDGVMTRNWKVRPMTSEEIERRDAPETAKQKLIDLGLTQFEVEAIVRGLR